MEVVLAEVEGSESKSSEDGDAARGMLSYDWSDMFAVLCGSPDDRKGALIRSLLRQGSCVGVTAVFRIQRSLWLLSEQSRCMTTHDSWHHAAVPTSDNVIHLGTFPTLSDPRLAGAKIIRAKKSLAE